MKKVIFDTNALMIPAEQKIDVFEEVEKQIGNHHAIAPNSVIEELQKMSEKSKDAKIGLELARQNCIQQKIDIENKNSGGTDEDIIELARTLKEKENNDIQVVTNDRELRKKLLEKNIPVFYLRQKKTLEKKRP